MTYYETMYIANPDATDEKIAALGDKLKGVLTKNGANVVNFEDWGKKKLAYRVKKQVKGHFILINYEGPPNSISELERIMKVTDDVLKFISVKLTKDEIARLQKRLDARRAAREKSAAEPPPAEPKDIDTSEKPE